MKTYSVIGLRDNLAKVIDAVIEGEVVVIERNRAPVARLGPLSTRDLAEWRRHRAAERGKEKAQGEGSE